MLLSWSLQVAFVILSLSTPVAPLMIYAQQTLPRQTSGQVTGQRNQTNEPAPKDPEAVRVLNQALTVAGGMTAIKAIRDYTATGNERYVGSSASNPVTFSARGFGDFRRDTSLSTGTRSWTVTAGQVSAKSEDGTVRLIHSQAPMNTSGFVIPYLQLIAALDRPQLRLSYRGTTQINGHSVHKVRVQQVSLLNINVNLPTQTIEFYVDASTFQVVSAQDVLPKGVPHELQYSDYRPVNGVLVPFSISESIAGQPNCVIQLSQVSINAGLTKASFEQ